MSKQNTFTERSGVDPVLTTERDQLRRSREYLRLMREDVLSLKAMGGDPVSEEYLKADLYHRAEALKDIPDAPLFFGRLDYAAHPETGQSGTGQSGTGKYGTGISETGGAEDDGIAGHSFHIGRRHVHAPDGTPAVIDWRAPVSRPFYRASAADPMNLALRRRFGFSGGELTAYEDERFTPDRSESSASPGGRPPGTPRIEKTGPSRILIDEIERPRSGPMRDIVATIQPDQDDIVRADAGQTVCVQGAPGTGKTAVGLHRVAYLLYAYREQVRRRGVVVVGPNRAFLSYIRNVLPALGELDVTQTTVGELVRSDGASGSRGPRGPRPRWPSSAPTPRPPPWSRATRGWPRCCGGRCGPRCGARPRPSSCRAGPGGGGCPPTSSPSSSPSCAPAASATARPANCSSTGSRT